MKKKEKQNPFSRRQALGILGAAGVVAQYTDPLKVLLNSIIDSVISTSHAAGPSKNLINIACPGGRATWGSFTPGRIRASDSFMANGAVVNWLSNGSYSNNNSNATYRLEQMSINGKSMLLPAVWKNGRIAVPGGWAPASTLLPYMLSIGFKTVDFGHSKGPANALKNNPVGSSLHGELADASGKNLPAVGLSRYAYSWNADDPKYTGFKSKTGVSSLLVKGLSSSPIEDILSSFIHSDSALSKARIASFRAMMTQALSEIAQYQSSTQPGTDVLKKNADKALAMFSRNWGDLLAQYQSIVAVYRDVETRAMTQIVPNIIPASGSGSYQPGGRFDLGMAEMAAVAEFLIKEGLSVAVTISTKNSVQVGNLRNYHDEHRQGDRSLSVITDAGHTLGTLSIIETLRRRLGPQLSKETDFAITTEFGRTPQHQGGGSDHGPDAGRLVLFDEDLKNGPFFLGNQVTVGRGPTAVNRGTWGKAGPTQTEFGQMTISHGNALATVATALRVNAPNRDHSLMDANGNILAEEQKNV